MKFHLEKLAVAVVVGIAAIVNVLSDNLDPYALFIFLLIGINITLAVSLNLVTGYTGQFSLGHAGFMAVGAYTSAVLTTVWGRDLLKIMGGAHLWSEAILFVSALICGGITASIAGLIVGVPSLRLRGDYLAIVTLGFGEIIRVLIQNWEFVGAARGLHGIPSYSNLFWVFLVAAVCVYVIVCLVNSTYGRGFLATRDDEIAAEAMGVNTTKYKVVAFVLGAFFAGIAGGLFAHTIGYISPDGFDFLMSVNIIIMVILGGMGNTLGVVSAAVLLTVINELLRPFATYRMIVFSLLLIIIMVLRPQGLLGNVDVAAWLRRRRKPGGLPQP